MAYSIGSMEHGIGGDAEGRRPSPHLAFPVEAEGGGTDDESSLGVNSVTKEYRLSCLTQSGSVTEQSMISSEVVLDAGVLKLIGLNLWRVRGAIEEWSDRSACDNVKILSHSIS